jgi:preprotein translocase subunit YajC
MESAPMYFVSGWMATASITSLSALQVGDRIMATTIITAKLTAFICFVFILLFRVVRQQEQQRQAQQTNRKIEE